MNEGALNQLADIMVDWSGVDINNLLQGWERGSQQDQTAPAAREIIKCLVWTLSQEPEARRLLQALVDGERDDWRFRP